MATDGADRQIETVIFDVDETLLYETETEGEAFLELANWVESYRLACWETALVTSGFGGSDPRVASTETRRVRNRYHRAFPDAAEVLVSLRRSYRIGILTNGAPGVQRAKIHGAGIDRHVDAIVVSGEVGHGKPHPRTFEAISKKLDTPPERCVMVGDNLEKDVRGAIAFGMEAVLFDRSDRLCDASQAPVRHRIRRLSELPDLMARPGTGV